MVISSVVLSRCVTYPAKNAWDAYANFSKWTFISTTDWDSHYLILYRVTTVRVKSWKVMEFSKTVFHAWKVMENKQGHGKLWKIMMSCNFFVTMHLSFCLCKHHAVCSFTGLTYWLISHNYASMWNHYRRKDARSKKQVIWNYQAVMCKSLSTHEIGVLPVRIQTYYTISDRISNW